MFRAWSKGLRVAEIKNKKLLNELLLAGEEESKALNKLKKTAEDMAKSTEEYVLPHKRASNGRMG